MHDLKKAYRILTVAVLSVASVVQLTSCYFIDFYDSYTITKTYSSDNSKKEKGTEPSEPTNETLKPTVTHVTETTVYEKPDPEYVKSILVYSVWYDAVEANPLTDFRVDSIDAFALKGVFYFSEPLTAHFTAQLMYGDEIILTRGVDLKDNVTAEADFSAGLEGFGTFERGEYTIELYYEGDLIGVTDVMRVT